jgi:putative aldouronate transport system substrate-binding protein
MPGESGNAARLSRRELLVKAAFGVAIPLLAACSAGAPAAPAVTTAPAAAKPTSAPAAPPTTAPAAPAPTTAPAAAAKPTQAPAVAPPAPAAPRTNPLLPSYIPTSGGPKPDFPSKGPLYQDGFVNYPANPSKALPAEPPGLGGNVLAIAPGLYPPPTPMDDNPAWKEVNKRLNVTFQFNIVANPGDYPVKLATTMAGNDLPDLIYFQGGVDGVANVPAFLQKSCADLTPYLSGDAIKEYPHLAAIPTFAWQNAGCLASGKLQMVPLQRYAPATSLFKNANVYDAEIGASYVPKNADDLKRVFQALNKPTEGRYATSAYTSSGTARVLPIAFHIHWYAALFGAPNNWRLEPSGKLVRSFETPEYKEAVGYVRDLVAAGVFSPDTLSYNNINSARADFVAGKFVLYPEGFGNPWNDFWRRGLLRTPPVNFLALPPFAAHDGGKPTHFLSTGYLGATALKAAPPERIKELLRILNWLAAPFGSEEDLLLTSGIKDIDYKLDDKGNPVLNDRGNQDANYVPWKYVVQHPQVIYVPDIPNYAKTLSEAEQFLIPAGVADPTLGFYAPTSSTKGPILNQAVGDGLQEIIGGRRPLTDFDGIVRDWATGGGEQMRKEFEDAIAASKA